MAARPIASSTISFGLVSLPVKLYSTGESSRKVTFNWLSRETGARLKQQYVDSQTGEVVERDDMVKGYEFRKNQYVVFEAEELKAIEAQSTEHIEITEFIPAGEVDREYLDRAYYLGPDKGGARAYRLLSAALRETGRVAVGKYSARGKQYLVLIRPKDDGLVLEQLYYPDEVRSFEEVPRESGEVQEAELRLAMQLVEQASSGAFDPGKYHDEVRDRVQALIDRKVEGEQITVAPSEEPETRIIDLMEALKASIAQGSDRIGPEKAGSPAAASRAARAGKKKASG